MNTRMPEEDPQYWLQRQAIIEKYAKKTADNSQNDLSERYTWGMDRSPAVTE